MKASGCRVAVDFPAPYGAKALKPENLQVATDLERRLDALCTPEILASGEVARPVPAFFLFGNINREVLGFQEAQQAWASMGAKERYIYERYAAIGKSRFEQASSSNSRFSR